MRVAPAVRSGSGHEQVGEGQYGGSDAHCDQDIVGAQIVHGIEGLVRFLGHPPFLRGSERIACEVVHTEAGFFRRGVAGSTRARRRTGRWNSERPYGGAVRIGSCGCRCWSTPWRRPPDPRCAPSLVPRRYFSVCAPSLRSRCRTIPLRRQPSAGVTEHVSSKALGYSPASFRRGLLLRSRARSSASPRAM